MASEIVGTIDYYIRQAKVFLAQLQQLRTRFRGPGPEIARDILGEVGGAFGESLLESPLGRRLGKKFAKRLLTQQQSQQLALEEQRIADNFSILLVNLSSFLASISVRGPGLQPNGDSGLLLRRFSKIHEAARLETRIGRTLAIIEAMKNRPLIYNKDIPHWLEQERAGKLVEGEPYGVLRQLETELRRFIESKLGAVAPNWWEARIPDAVKRKAAERKGRNESLWPWHTRRGLHLIHYIDFGDYMKIITRRDNWEQVFEAVFKDREIISGKLRELEPVRNAIAHFRELSTEEEEKLRIYAKEMLRALRV